VNKTKIRHLEKSFYANYLKRAEECSKAAQESFSRKDWTAATINAIHATIAASDALTVRVLGKRASGPHGEVGALLKTLPLDAKDIQTNLTRLERILDIKHIAEYEERLIEAGEAERALKDMERFVQFVIRHLGAS